MVNRLVKESDFRASLIRTLVPLLVGTILALALRAGIDLGDWQAPITEGVTLVVSAIYYAVIRWLETVKSSKWGWLLGYPAKPQYDLAA